MIAHTIRVLPEGLDGPTKSSRTAIDCRSCGVLVERPSIPGVSAYQAFESSALLAMSLSVCQVILEIDAGAQSPQRLQAPFWAVLS
jgi:hypothetical protein